MISENDKYTIKHINLINKRIEEIADLIQKNFEIIKELNIKGGDSVEKK